MKKRTDAIDSIQMSKQEAGELVNKNLKRIRKIIKSKMSLYSLNFKTVFEKFIKEIKEKDYEMIRRMPSQDKFETYLESMIKKFLIKEAYFALVEECIHKRISNKLKTSNTSDFNYMEIVDFVTTRIEKNDLEKLYRFREKAMFKTFIHAIVSHQLGDFWRSRYKIKEKIDAFGHELSEQYNIDRDDPLLRLIRSETEEIKEKITEVLTVKQQEADQNEWVAFEMFYYEGMSLISIARTFKTSEYKAKKMIANLRNNIISEVLKEIK